MNKKAERHFTEKHLLEKGLDKPIVLVAYDGNVLIKEQVKVLKYDLKYDGAKPIPKLNVMFAFPFGEFETLSTRITLNKTVEDQQLKPIMTIKKRPVVATQQEYKKAINQNVRITMRTGHVLSGQQIYETQYTLILRIAGKNVLVYKHGILVYEVQRETEDVP